MMIKVPNIALILVFLAFQVQGQTNFASQREKMVRTQIKTRGITNPVTLYAMLNVPRHEFVPDSQKDYSYSDSPLPIGKGQTISQPFIVAYMTQALKLESTDKVLEVGTGSGYQAAVLAKIVDSVYTIEIIKELALSSKKKMQTLGYSNITVKWGDGYNGWPNKAPFDAIMVTAGAESIPQPLIDQLKVGGRMIIPVGPHYGTRQLVLIIKKKNKVVKKNVMLVRFVPLTRKIRE